MAGLTHATSGDSVFGTKAGFNNGKSDSAESAGASPLCPKCSSRRVWRDGVRVLADGSSVQRWLCCSCGFRFSESKLLKSGGAIEFNCQICVSETKNLASATETKTVAGDRKKSPRHIDLLPAEVRGLLTKFMAYLERNGFDKEIQYPAIIVHLVRDGAYLLDPESVKAIIAKQRKRNGEPWTDSMKMLATCAYDAFCQMQGIVWQRPNYRQNEVTIIMPDEKDLDLLISAAGSKRMAAFLLCLKETFAGPSEILRCEWKDLPGNVLSINHPVKYHDPGKYELSPRLTAMLNALPRKSSRIFPMSYRTAYTGLAYLRRRAADKFSNPDLLRISFKSFRHWGGSMLAYVLHGNVPEMVRILRHKSWKSTQRYVHTIAFKDEDFDVATATTAEEILALGKAGWEKYDEAVFNNVTVHFYRKPKRFQNCKTMNDKSQVMGISNYNS